LVLLFTDVESNLVGVEVVFGFGDALEEACILFWVLEEELALGNLVVVEITLLVAVLDN